MHVAEAYKSRLFNWPQIKDGDSAGLQAPSDFLFRCHEAVRIVGSSGELDSTPTLTLSGVVTHTILGRNPDQTCLSPNSFNSSRKNPIRQMIQSYHRTSWKGKERALKLQRIIEAKDKTRHTALPLAPSRNSSRYAREHTPSLNVESSRRKGWKREESL